MWNQMNQRLAANEYAANALHSHQVAFNRNSSGFNDESSIPYPGHMPSLTKDHMLNSKFSTKESDSGFLSGMSLQEEGLDSESCLATDKHSDKIHQSTTMYSDSGLDLNVSSHDLNSKPAQITPVSNLPQTRTKDHVRQISVSDLLRPDEDGDTALHLAVIQGFIEVVFSLVRLISDPCLLDIPNNKHQTPLHLAVLTNQAPLVRRLVVGGSNVLLRDGHGNTPLHLACREGFFECAKALCIPIAQEERQAALLHDTIPPQPLPQDLESRNYEGQMPLHLAAMNGHGQIAKLLCCFGANVNATESKYGRTALHYAVERRHPALLHFLITQCDALTEAETYSGYTAFQIAAASAPMLAGLLVNLGAQPRPNLRDTLSSDGEESEYSDDSSEEL